MSTMPPQSFTTSAHNTLPYEDPSDIPIVMEPVNNAYSVIHEMSSIIPKLHNAQKTSLAELRHLNDQLKVIHLSSAQMDNPFSNPDDPFAEFCHSMGVELSNIELLETEYANKLNAHLLAPIKQFKTHSLRNVYNLHSTYYESLEKLHHSSTQHNHTSNQSQRPHKHPLAAIYQMNGIEQRLKSEVYQLKYAQNVPLLNHMDTYWQSLITFSESQAHAINTRGALRDRDPSKYNDERDAKESNDKQTKFEIDFDIQAIDDAVGFSNIKNDIRRYTVKLVTHHADKQAHKRVGSTSKKHKSKKYNRVLYVDCTNIQRKLKILTLKKHIQVYKLSDIACIEKSYKNIQLLRIKFKNNTQYFYEFESPSKREQFVGQILEYDRYIDGTFTKKKNKLMSIVIGSYNVGESECLRENIQHWLKPCTAKHSHHDMYVLGLQEVKTKLKKQWMDNLLAYIDDFTKQYICLHNKWLMSIGIVIIIHASHIAKISHIQSQTVATGKANLIGNKGAAAVSLQFMETTFLFVNCHLAARAERFEKRGKNFTRIVKELKIGNIENVDILHQFQHVFWFGDLNYRIEKPFNDVIRSIKRKRWAEIIEFDQLYNAMKFDSVFAGFTEGKICFCPTYRWNKTRNIVSNKRNQPPSYTDRILYRTLPNSLSLWQETYTGHPKCLGSDHRPILSTFRFKPRLPYTFRRKYSGISISFVELKAVVEHAKRQFDLEILFNFIYSQPTQHKLQGGRCGRDGNFRWPMIQLDDLKIEPFVSDPSFLCTTHIALSFVQRGTILGHSVISLFNAFPKTLIDTEKLKKDYMFSNMQMETMSNKHTNKQQIKKEQITYNHKQFKIVISKQGAHVGFLEGMLFIDGKIIRKHLRYSTLDAHKKARGPQSQVSGLGRNRRSAMAMMDPKVARKGTVQSVRPGLPRMMSGQRNAKVARKGTVQSRAMPRMMSVQTGMRNPAPRPQFHTHTSGARTPTLNTHAGRTRTPTVISSASGARTPTYTRQPMRTRTPTAVVSKSPARKRRSNKNKIKTNDKLMNAMYARTMTDMNFANTFTSRKLLLDGVMGSDEDDNDDSNFKF
eukprot:56674_1